MRERVRRLATGFSAWAERMGEDRLRRLVAFTSLGLLVAALVPLLGISAFNHSYADDWHYGVDAHLALQAGGTLFDAVGAALAEVAETYVDWQGTYSAIFLMALQPGVFGEGFYALAAPLILASLVAATAYASHALLVGALHADRSTWVTVTCLVLLLQTQLLPSPVEGIYWYNSAVYYTFYHALMLVMVGLGVRMVLPGRSGGRLAGRACALAFLAFAVAGGNFVTALVTLELLAAATVALVVRRRREWTAFAPALAVHVAGFAASMLAPGNAARQAVQFPGDALSAPLTVLRSAFAGWEYATLWTNGLLVLALAAAAPMLLRAARRSGLRFRLPGLVLFASLVLFATSFTPTFFSMGTVGPGRVQNVRYDLFVVLAFTCTTWLLGWWSQRRAEVAPAPSRRRCVRLALAWAVVSASVACVLVSFALDERHVDDLTSLSAAASLASGQAAEYDRQVDERLAYIEGSSSSTLEVPFYTVGPKVLFMGDIRGDMDNYINYRLAQWYGKDVIVGRSASQGDGA